MRRYRNRTKIHQNKEARRKLRKQQSDLHPEDMQLLAPLQAEATMFRAAAVLEAELAGAPGSTDAEVNAS